MNVLEVIVRTNELFGSDIQTFSGELNDTVTLKNDSRVLPFGKFLRKTKLNELPQLFHIYKGLDFSLEKD
jgi:lipopolysaccharide/colanic/teichoic acid biosynthesis glycosyltransferase